jgi:uncharacterized protein (TIGR02266 family)
MGVGVEDLRRDRRVSIEVDVNLESESNFYAGIANNLSQGGLFVATYTPPPLGATVALSLKLDDKHSFQLTGTVCWTRDPAHSTELSPAGCGIRWVALPTEAKTAITHFIENVRDTIFHDED